MHEIDIRQALRNLSTGDTFEVDRASIAASPPAISEDDEYAYAEQVRERIRGLCAEFGAYSLELDQDGPVEDQIEFRKVAMPPS